MVMTGILTVEMIVEGQKGGRLTWPYNDLVPGNYLSKVGLPAFTVMVALAIGGSRKIAGLMALTSLITIVLSVLTGERINFLIRACGGMLAGLIWRPRFSPVVTSSDRGGSCRGHIFVCGRASITVCDRSGVGNSDILLK